MKENLTVSRPGGSPVASAALSPKVVAAISAAVVVTLGQTARIRRIRYWRARPTSAWAVQGRVSIMNSHGTRR
ncbi:MAG: hypothetical protein Fur0044_21640 [Anaerolineae bacterium]|jgi:hypothetical protein|nr:hypothetical protein [Anaerolineales bacterium]MCQ3972939.1 hypothetical protein [Anaerolineae bacterium]